ncbi:MAG: TIGR00730 family Rossman fold protein [Alphaproteobacteria bacterium]|nr:MAG: TIGR00730 family Rossman fold protein [Alphaproteobacteria bacterium]
MSAIRTVCVYCGSSPGTDPAFLEAARRLGKILAGDGVGLVYGGGSYGLMGALATSVLDHGGHVTGIIPEFLQDREHTLRRAQEIIVTPDMHVRKQTMFDKADAFVALPGGIGTLEELIEQMTWAQLGRHKKPILILNVSGFWNPLCALLDHMRGMEFIRAERSMALLVAATPEEVLPKLRKAAADVTEREKRGKPETVERM